MFRKLDEAAQKFSARVSRRGFLDRLGGTALTTATALGAFLVLQTQARAAPKDLGACCMGGEDGRQIICRRRKGQKDCPPGWIKVRCVFNVPFCEEI